VEYVCVSLSRHRDDRFWCPKSDSVCVDRERVREEGGREGGMEGGSERERECERHERERE
jgi:hypothetical protein